MSLAEIYKIDTCRLQSDLMAIPQEIAKIYRDRSLQELKRKLIQTFDFESSTAD